MKVDYLEFMGKIIDKGYVLVILSKEVLFFLGCFWYLLYFVIYYNIKCIICVVFDFSCEYGGILLNKVFLLGFDLMNNFIGVFMCFCKENIVVMCDVE